VIPRDSSAGVHYTLVDTSNPNFVDILIFFLLRSQAGYSVEIRK